MASEPAPVDESSGLEDAPPVPLRRIIALARPEVPTLVAATGALLISTGMTLAYPQAARLFVDGMITRGAVANIDETALLLALLFAVQAVFTMIRSWLFTVAGERVVARLREQLYAAIIRQEIGFFDTTRTGELTNRLASDTTVLQNTVTVNVSMALRYAIGALGGLGMLLWMSPTLTSVMVLVVPVVAIAAAVYGRSIRRLSNEVQNALARSTTVAEESISGVRTVRSFARENHEQTRYATAVQDSYKVAARRALTVGLFSGFVGFAGYSALTLVMWYGGQLVIDEQMTEGELTAFLLYTLTVAVSLGALANLWGDFMRASGSSQRVFQLIDRGSLIPSGEGASIATVLGDMKLQSITFAYPSRPDAEVLTDFSLSIAQGEVVALVGPSGSGKSTVAQLLLRFYDPQQGTILLDDRDIRELDPDALRTHVGIVRQEPILFATTISENIRYGRPDATDDEVLAAAKAANADTFIHGFPDRYDTLVGERGVRLSGGQKQRIAIARALLKDPRVLILDEATSALDAESEHLVQEALERLMQGRTTLVIAHRLSTVASADRVVVLSAGQVAEQGSHRELLAQGGLYRKLVERQFAIDMPPLDTAPLAS